MPDLLLQLVEGFTFTGNLAQDAPAFLCHHGRADLARHTELVAANAEAIATQVGADPQAALAAAWVHDTSQVLPYAAMLEPAFHYGLELLPEERRVPMLLHGKLSAVFAGKLFGVYDPAVLDAVRCHTTLRPDPTLLDKVLFVADKLAWAPHEAPYHTDLETALHRSLDEAVACFLAWLWQQRHPAVHPWMRGAYEQFCLHKGEANA